PLKLKSFFYVSNVQQTMLELNPNSDAKLMRTACVFTLCFWAISGFPVYDVVFALSIIYFTNFHNSIYIYLEKLDSKM
ncbi:MAG: hypothetical protein LE180_06500, partial [Endomicrobium sp.]|uniref:hypothetical protein n=1 Tax=Candidatus Endomicrobiellum pyrsonymphae TaxID=1408203 RepID=UPI00357E2E5F|nr:hypothetical protein [Endomicrobium sp.]